MSVDISTDMSVDIATDISVEGCWSSIGRYIDIAADIRPIR